VIPTRFSRALDIRRVELHEIDRRLIVLVRRLPIVNGRFWPVAAFRRWLVWVESPPSDGEHLSERFGYYNF
ncbi:hypothetical protein, partial [Pseudomonas viridiflava]|uniref:hypothetical protein n=1 Tax=Pseudomonas viridiflava TaxID=33069 RepID=UPI00197E9992